MLLAVFTAVSTAEPANAAADDAVGPSFYHNPSAQCRTIKPFTDPLGGFGGVSGLTAYIFPVNYECNTAIWSDYYAFTRGRACTIDAYISGSANANVTYHVEFDDLKTGATDSIPFTLNQDPYYGWHRLFYGAAVYSIRTVWMDDTTWGAASRG